MKAYIGAKIIQAEPMDEVTFLKEVKKESRVELIENRETRPGYHVLYPGHYHSWSPKEVFEEAYRPINEGEKDLIFHEH